MTYSLDFRQKVLEVKKAQDLTFEETAALFKVGKATLVRWVKNIHAQKTRNKPCTKIDMDQLKQDIENFPDAYIHERAERLGCSPSGLWSALGRLKVSYKKNPGTPQIGHRKKIYILRKD